MLSAENQVLARNRSAAIILLAALGYFVCGKLGIYLAIPPGYATAVWPSSGVALALAICYGRISYPGTWLGSYLINIGISNGFDNPSLTALTMPAIIALGAVLQAEAGRLLVLPHVRQIWSSFRAILQLLLLGGPISCLLAASIGVCSLLAFQQITLDHFVEIWITWWIGDTMGVLAFMPALLVLLGFRHTVPLGKRLTVVMPLVAIFLLVTIAYVLVRDFEEQKRRELVASALEQIHHDIEREMATTVEIADTLATYFAITDNPTPEDFQAFTTPFLRRHPNLQALEWVPRVTAKQRATFEQRMRDLGLTDYRLRERRGDSMVPAQSRPVHFPVAYIEPISHNHMALGFDLASNAARNTTLQKAESQRSAAITPPVELVQMAPGTIGYLWFEPVFVRRHGTTGTRSESRLRGFILMVFVPQTLIRESSPTASNPALALSLKDVTDPDQPVELIQSDGGLADYQATLPFSLLDRTWQLTLTPSLSFLLQVPHWQSYAVLFSGWPFITVLSVLLITLTGRQAAIEQQVEEKTAALADATHQAQRASRAKTDFLANMSHELRTPLNSIIGFTRQLITKKKEQLDARSMDSLATVERNARHLLQLINDLLDISKIEAGRFELSPSHFNVLQLCQEVVEPFKPQAREKHIQLRVTADEPLALSADRLRVYQVLLNLVSNAVKFTSQGGVHLRAVQENRDGVPGVRLDVEDTGVGIAPEQQPLLFQKFVQLSEGKQAGSGTGLGLALAREIALLHQGDLTLRSEPGKGSTFSLWLPAGSETPLAF